MAEHLAAYQAAIDSATLTPIATVVDDVLTRSGTTRFLVPADIPVIRWGIAAGINITRAIFSAPSLEVRRMRVDIVPHQRGVETLTPSSPEIFIPPVPIALAPTEEIEAQCSEDGAGATQCDVLLSLGPAELPAIPSGDIRMVRATAATALVARAWTTISPTLDQALEPGEYALIGFLPISTTCLAARALITGQVYRPGVPGLPGAESAAREVELGQIYQTMFYDMGHFDHLTIPQFQFWASAADAAEVVLLFIVKTG